MKDKNAIRQNIYKMKNKKDKCGKMKAKKQQDEIYKMTLLTVKRNKMEKVKYI